MSDSPVPRRTLLFAAATTVAAGGLGGCAAGPTEPPSPSKGSIEALTPVLLGQQELLASYEQTLSAFPELAEQLSDLQAQTSAHTDALLDAAPAAAAQVSAASSGPSPSALPSSEPSSTLPIPSPIPLVDAATALSELARGVDAAAGALRAAALRADGDLAALVGSCAASAACHAWLLEP